jgi:type I restriction enzyme M protein
VGWEGKLIPKALVECTFFSEERAVIDELKNKMEEAQGLLTEWIEEQSGEDGILSSEDEDAEEGEEKEIKVTTKTLAALIAEIQSQTESEEISELESFLVAFVENGMKKKDALAYISEHPLCEKAVNEKGSVSKATITKAIIEVRASTPVKEVYRADYEELIKAYEWADTIEASKKAIKAQETELEKMVRAKYAELTDEEVKDLLINKKWLSSIESGINAIYVSISHDLAGRVTELGERYESTLSELTSSTEEFESKAKAHLERMGFVW